MGWTYVFKGKGKGKGKGPGQQRTAASTSRAPRAGPQRAPKCSNCHADHATRDCTKAIVDKKTCFKCNTLGHVARFCPNNGPTADVKALAEKVMSNASKQRSCFNVN